MVDTPNGSSSHATADVCNHLLLNHYVALVQARGVKRLLSLKNEMIRLNIPFLKSGYLCNSLANLFEKTYNVDIWTCDFDVLRSRITWVQGHEERRGFYDFYGV